MKGISLILGNEVKTKQCHPCKMAKISAKNGESKLAKMSAKNEERKMARMNAKHEDNMAAEQRARYKRHSRSQSEKVERKEAKPPNLRKQKDKRTSRQRKDKTPTNNGDKFPNTYREDKRKIRGPPHMAKEEFEKGDEVIAVLKTTQIVLRDFDLNNTQQRKFLFAALRRFVLGAARLVVFRLAGCLRRNGLAGCWKWQRVVGRVREVFKATV